MLLKRGSIKLCIAKNLKRSISKRNLWGSDKTSETKRNPSTGISEWFWQERKIVLQLDR